MIASSSSLAEICDLKTGRIVGQLRTVPEKPKLPGFSHRLQMPTTSAFASMDGSGLTTVHQSTYSRTTDDPDEELASIDRAMVHLSLDLDSELRRASFDVRSPLNGRLMPSPATHGTGAVWNSNVPKASQAEQPPWITAIKMSPDGCSVAIGDSAGTLQVMIEWTQAAPCFNSTRVSAM